MEASLGCRALNRQVRDCLRASSQAEALAAVALMPEAKVVKPLFSCLCSTEPLVKWHAVAAMGQTVAALATAEMESARVVMRRFMWMLNDESGGIGWGVPEAMAESIACHPRLAAEYSHCLISFMREDGFYLELPALQQGLLWGVARVAEVFAQLLRDKDAVRYLLPYLDAADPGVRGLACLALGRLGDTSVLAALAPCQGDGRAVCLYQAGDFVQTTVDALACQAIGSLSRPQGDS